MASEATVLTNELVAARQQHDHAKASFEKHCKELVAMIESLEAAERDAATAPQNANLAKAM